jgi:hypothetical protein
MDDPDAPEQPRPAPLEVDVAPPVLGRLARWLERSRVARRRLEAARDRHSSLDLAFNLVELDASIGGGLLAGALAYRLFVLLLPTALLFVSGIGLYADAADKSTRTVAREAGLQGLIASQVASTASSSGRWTVFILVVPVAVYALAKLYRAIAITHAIVWHRSGRGVRVTPRGVGAAATMLILTLLAAELSHWARQSGPGEAFALLAYLVLVAGAGCCSHASSLTARWGGPRSCRAQRPWASGSCSSTSSTSSSRPGSSRTAPTRTARSGSRRRCSSRSCSSDG